MSEHVGLLHTSTRCKLSATHRSSAQSILVSYVPEGWDGTPHGWYQPQWPRGTERTCSASVPTPGSLTDCGWAASMAIVSLPRLEAKREQVSSLQADRIMGKSPWLYGGFSTSHLPLSLRHSPAGITTEILSALPEQWRAPHSKSCFLDTMRL
jgi:hypothetical protein